LPGAVEWNACGVRRSKPLSYMLGLGTGQADANVIDEIAAGAKPQVSWPEQICPWRS
jgi:hypothetical protein